MFDWFFKWFYKFRGWTLGDNLSPEIKKCVMIVVPHTSGWDLVYGTGANLLLNLDAKFLMKKEVFKWPLKKLFLHLGGIPVDRSRNLGLTELMIEYLRTHERAVIAYTPEGTRRRVTRWRKGFYYAAQGADVPVVMAYIDYKEKKAGVGPSFIPSGDIAKDFEIIRDFYRNVTGCKPENFALPE